LVGERVDWKVGTSVAGWVVMMVMMASLLVVAKDVY